MKIAVGASAGGHMNELQQLLSSEFGKKIKPSYYISTKSLISDSIETENIKVYSLGECNRETFWLIPIVFFRALRCYLKTRPEVIISTGALPIAIYCFIGKKFGARIIWIDSIANIDQLSMSGRWALKFADRIYTQWPDLSSEQVLYKGYLI